MIINFFSFVFCSFLIITNIIYIKENKEFIDEASGIILPFFEFNFFIKLILFILYFVYFMLIIFNILTHCCNKFLIYIFYFENTLNIIIYLVKHFMSKFLFLQLFTYLVIFILKKISYYKNKNNIESVVVEPVLQEEVPDFSVQQIPRRERNLSVVIEEDLEIRYDGDEDEGYINNGYSNNCYDDNNYWAATEGL